MSVTVFPSFLAYHRPLAKTAVCQFAISNSHIDEVVAFKIKTNAVKSYNVRPNIGCIKPGESAVITVTMLAKKTEPPLSEACRDKIMIESTTLPPEWAGTMSRDFHEAQNLRCTIHQLKIPVIYVNPPVPLIHDEAASRPSLLRWCLQALSRRSP
ncbi:hypothetical protein JAAARDRAFT_456069 [Jaapia argillacea MUCL 33604]|uniref:MSP domain-containing protein n=1 Tax=Jaapia argillacea MUCL 33604 TaxID=933084 RepID=A0A067Q5H7_9AGAM|nr:hypothetical protein JAAARDRAFT_456069 [Jaapia argillacea MUCL 33604]